MDKEKLIHRRAAEARIFLHIHGFLADSENGKVAERIEKYRKNIDKVGKKEKTNG